MRLGFGLYRHMLNRENFRFAKQCGATHLIVHLVDYFRRDEETGPDNQPVGDRQGWGYAGDPDRLWTLEELVALKRMVNAEGLELEGIENIDPAFWHDVLLDGPKKREQLETVKTLVRRIGQAGIPVLGYNFSLAGVAGRIEGPFARGGAVAVGMDGVDETRIPKGMVWNMVYDRDAPAGTLEPVTVEQLWQRLAEFLREVVPVAEEAGVRLAAHPDDPPMPTVRGTPRLVYEPDLYQRLIDLLPSRSNGLEFCLGTIAEMAAGDVHQATDRYSRQGKIVYVHFRNVRGKVPHYREVFVDEGDVDMFRVLRILRDNGFEGVLIPDHAPQMTCNAPWHAGMAFAMGYMKAAMRAVGA